EPNIKISIVSVLVAVIANFIFGAIWYMPLFGRAWAKEMQVDMSGPKPSSAVMIKGMSIMIIGNFLMAYVFAHNIAVWNPVTWGQAPSTISNAQSACMAAFFTWLGFYVPQD